MFTLSIFGLLILHAAIVEESELSMPSIADIGETVALSCTIDAEIQVKSIIWLKDDEQFYEYQLLPEKVEYVSAVTGVEVVKSKLIAHGNRIHVKLKTSESCGRYACYIKSNNVDLKFIEMCGTLKVIEPSNMWLVDDYD